MQASDPLFVSSHNNTLSLSEQIQAMSTFQTNLARFFDHQNYQLSHKSEQLKQSTLFAQQQTSKIKQLLNQFVYQCKNQWVMVWQQFFSLFQRIVDLYQIKIQKLEANMLQKDMRIETLQFQEKSLKEMFRFTELPMCQMQESKQIEMSSNKIDESEMLNDKTQRRVKISDVIAEYTQSNSVSAASSSNHLISYGQAVTEEPQQQLQDSQSQAPIVLMQIAEHLNRQNLSINRNLFKQLHKHSQRMTDNCFEMSAILSANSSQGVSPQKDMKFKKYSTRTSKENSLAYSKRMKENEQGKKRTNYYSKNGKGYDSQVLSTGCKLDELRKNLLQKKKSEHLL